MFCKFFDLMSRTWDIEVERACAYNDDTDDDDNDNERAFVTSR